MLGKTDVCDVVLQERKNEISYCQRMPMGHMIASESLNSFLCIC